MLFDVEVRIVFSYGFVFFISGFLSLFRLLVDFIDLTDIFVVRYKKV